MSRTKRDILDTESMLQRLSNVLLEHRDLGVNTETGLPSLVARDDAESLRRISMTLHRWHELECGTDGGCIERGRLSRVWDETTQKRESHFDSDENGRPYWANHNGNRPSYSATPDREKGALARLAAIMARYPALTSYVQGDPRGCSPFILRPGDVPAGQSPDAFYSRGLAVHQ